MMKNQKGITLIALVITIIVLLILAGVSIAMLTGENGILTKAAESKTVTDKAEAVEKINLALNAAKTEIYKQQVDTTSWQPVTATTAEGATTYAFNGNAIKDVIALDGFTTETGSGKYHYELDASNGLLTLSYYNDTTKVGDSDHPVKGTINLAASPYTITKAEK